MKAKKMEHFDSHEQVKNLMHTGFKEPQAEAIVKTLYYSRGSEIETLATKDQLNIVGQKLDNKTDQVEERLNNKIDQVEERLNNKIDQVEDRLNSKIDQFEERVNSKIDQVEERLNNKIDQGNMELHNKIDQSNIELHNKIDCMVEKILIIVKDAKFDTIKWMVGMFVTMMLTMVTLVLTLYFK